MILKPKTIVGVKVDYYLPDYVHILNEFYWQTQDYWPELPRVQKFLWFWHDNIDAVIHSVSVQHSEKCSWKIIDFEQEMK